MNLARIVAAVAVGLAVGASAPARAEGDPNAGIKKKQMCEGCHGIAGFRTAYPTVYTAPRLGGQSSGYIVKALQDYRSGARKHPSMNSVAGSLSDKDMADLAAYYGADAAK
jgi:cytochrome c553